MKLLTKANKEKLIQNHERNAERGDLDLVPVVKLFTPWANCTWLITEYDQETGSLFGLCDLGKGFPEIGPVSLGDIINTVGPAGLKIERDRHFKAEKTLSEYAEEARQAGAISA